MTDEEKKALKRIDYIQDLYEKLVDKIKAKILELKANKEKYIHKESMNCLLSQISILQSLLERR